MTKKDEVALFTMAFLDLLGFGMLVADVQLRAESLVPKGWYVGMVVGSLLAITFIIQTLVSPQWGRLSDRVGRKPIVVTCTLLSAAAMLVYGFASSLPLLFLSRIISGFGAANVAVAQAEIGARTSPEDRTKILGRLSAAISSGLIVGAPLGGFIAHRFGSHWVGYTAGAASLIGVAMIWILLTPSVPTSTEDRKTSRKLSPSLLRDIPAIRPYVIIAIVAWISLATLEGTFARLIHQLFKMDQQEFGIIFGYESLLGVLIQGAFLAWLVKRYSDSILLRCAYLCQGIGLALNPIAVLLPIPALVTLFGASTIYAFGAGVANPTVNGICSRLTPEARQGELFGLLQGTRSIGFVVGPIIGGQLFDWQPAAPYILAGCVSVLAAFLVPSVPPRTAPSFP